jgi:hypothetical protein
MASFLKFIIEQDFAYAQYLDIPKPRFPIFLYSKVPFSGKALELELYVEFRIDPLPGSHYHQ